jgi:hypothetical protein
MMSATATGLSALAIVRPETVIRWHPLAVWEPLQRRKKAQDTREPYLATTGGHEENHLGGGTKTRTRVSYLDGSINWTPTRYRIELSAEQLASMGATVQPNQSSEEIDVTEFVRRAERSGPAPDGPRSMPLCVPKTLSALFS